MTICPKPYHQIPSQYWVLWFWQSICKFLGKTWYFPRWLPSLHGGAPSLTHLSSPCDVSCDFPNTNMFILAGLPLPLPNWGSDFPCLSRSRPQVIPTKEEERLNTPSSVRESLGCAWHHDEDCHCGQSHRLDSLLKCKVGLPTNLIPDDPHNSAERLCRSPWEKMLTLSDVDLQIH